MVTATTIKGITCAVCTYKNPHTLCDTLDSLALQDMYGLEWEILVINNGCDINTTMTAESALKTRPNLPLRIICEPRIGLSYARNRAINEARYPLIAYIDDDAKATPNWLRRLANAFEDPNVWACGGPVLPDWQCKRPDWLSDDMLRNLSIVEWGNNSRWLQWPERIIGANMAFRISELIEIGCFNPLLGRIGNNMLGMEDTIIQDDMYQKGRSTYYIADAAVFHLIPAKRCTINYFFRRSYGYALSLSAINIDNSISTFFKIGLKIINNIYFILISPFWNTRKSIIYIMSLGYCLGKFIGHTKNIWYLHKNKS